MGGGGGDEGGGRVMKDKEHASCVIAKRQLGSCTQDERESIICT